MEDPFNIMEDFDIKAARVNISGSVAIVDNVKKVIIMSDTNITVDHSRCQVSLYGMNLNVEYIYDGRMRIKGKFAGIEFFSGLKSLSSLTRVTVPSANEANKAVRPSQRGRER